MSNIPASTSPNVCVTVGPLYIAHAQNEVIKRNGTLFTPVKPDEKEKKDESEKK